MRISKFSISDQPIEYPFILGSKDKHRFSQVFKEHYLGLCLFAERIVGSENAEDIVVDLFSRLWGLQQIINDEEHLKAFLYHSTKNSCLNFLRSDERANLRNTVYANIHGDIEDCYLAEITRTEIIRELYQAIEELPSQCSKIVKMGYLEGLSNVEIAEKLGLSIQTIKNQKGRAVALLRKRLPGDKFLLLLFLLHNLR